MDNNLYTYALIKGLYDQSHNFIDCFLPFIVGHFSSDKFIGVVDIQACVKNSLGMDMPIHVMESAIKRAKNKGLLSQEKSARRYQLTFKGAEYTRKHEDNRDVTRRINSLVDEIIRFFKDKQIEIKREDILELISSFVQENRASIIEFLNPNTNWNTTKLAKSSPNARLLIEFIQEVDRSRPDQHATLRDVLLGSLISTLIYARNTEELDRLGSKHFKECNIYLDTNLILSILELHEPDWNKPALELLKLLHLSGFKTFVLPSTITELCAVVDPYRSNLHRYPKNIKVDTIYSSLRRKGWRATDVNEFITNLEDLLKSKAITIDYKYSFDLKKYQIQDQNLLATLRRYKPFQHELGEAHDLLAIDIIRQMRSRECRALENCKAIFLTSDARLCKFNFAEQGHKNNGTICEVFLDRLLTNLLWLKNPGVDLPVSAIISAHARDLFINREVWNRFYDVLQQLHRDKKISENQIAMLFYHNYVEEFLLPLEESDVSKITPSFVLGFAQKKAELIDKDITSQVRQKEAELIADLDKQITTAELKANDEWLQKVSDIKERFRKEAEQASNRIILTIRIAPALTVLIFIGYLIYNGQWDNLQTIDATISIIIIMLSIIFNSLSSLLQMFHLWLSSWIFRRRFAKSYLARLETQI